jgi:hypothetical protein
MENPVNKAVQISLMTIATLVVAAIAEKIRSTIAAQVPEGYEDEGGFHFGNDNFQG